MIETLSIKDLAVFDVVSVYFGELNVIHDETGSGSTRSGVRTAHLELQPC